MGYIDHNKFRSYGYSFEEIQGIELGLKQANSGETISKQEMEEFKNKELFAKYSINV